MNAIIYGYEPFYQCYIYRSFFTFKNKFVIKCKLTSYRNQIKRYYRIYYLFFWWWTHCVILFLLMTSYCFLDVTKIIIDLNKWEILHQMEWVSYHLYCMSQKKKKNCLTDSKDFLTQTAQGERHIESKIIS